MLIVCTICTIIMRPLLGSISISKGKWFPYWWSLIPLFTNLFPLLFCFVFFGFALPLWMPHESSLFESSCLGNLNSVRKVTRSGSKNICTFNFYRCCPLLYKKAVNFQNSKLKLKVLFSFHTCQTLVLYFPLILPVNECKIISHCDFNFHFLNWELI